MASASDKFDFSLLTENYSRFLLRFGMAMSAISSREKLLDVIKQYVIELSIYNDPSIIMLNERQTISGSFLANPDQKRVSDSEYDSIISQQYSYPDGYLENIIMSEKPLHLDIATFLAKPNQPKYLHFLYRNGIKHMIGIPLHDKLNPVGALLLFSEVKKEIPEQEMNLLSAMSVLVSQAISNIKNQERISQNQKEKDTLLVISKEIAAVKSKFELLPILRRHFKKNGFYTDLAISLINDDLATTTGYLIDWEKRYQHPGYAKESTAKHPLADGILNAVLAANTPMAFDLEELMQAKKIPGYVRFLYERGIRHMVSVALTCRGKQLGIFYMLSGYQQVFSDSQLRLFQSITNELASAVANIITYEELAEAEKDKTLLLTLCRELAIVRDRESLLEVIHTQLKHVFELDDFVVALINEDGKTHSANVKNSETDKKISAKFKKISTEKFLIDDGIFNVALSSQHPIIWDIPQKAQKSGMPGYVYFWDKEGYKEMVGIPIGFNEEKLGGVFFMSKKTNTFSKNKLLLLHALSYHISLSVANIVANEEVLKRESENSFVLNLSKEINSSRTKESLLNIIKVQLGQILQYNATTVSLLHPGNATHSTYLYSLPEEMTSHPEMRTRTEEHYPVPDGVYETMLQSDGPVIYDMEALMTRPVVPGYVDFFYKNGIREMVAFPISLENKNIGGLWIHAKKRNAFSADQLKLTEAIVSHIAIAIANMKAYEQIESQLKEIQQYKSQLEEENLYLQEQINTTYYNTDIIGSGSKIQKVFDMINLVADTDSTVLIHGETGTGKELVARAIHNASKQKNKVMIKVNCAALPINLIESELFGHEKGSFTGAVERRIGKFELADNSTLFLDEIGEMPLESQVKLLRAIQEKEIERIGGKETISVNVRIIAATNKNLLKEVQEGRFRSDLFYRLEVFPIELPALRERLEDIPALTNHFIEKNAGKSGKKPHSIAKKALQDLVNYHWPGNIRELEHVIERSLLLATGNSIKEVYLPALGNQKPSAIPENSKIKSIMEMERDHIIEILTKTKWKISGKNGAAALLCVPPTTLHSKMKKLGISK